jgi:hypothetical protein
MLRWHKIIPNVLNKFFNQIATMQSQGSTWKEQRTEISTGTGSRSQGQSPTSELLKRIDLIFSPCDLCERFLNVYAKRLGVTEESFFDIKTT